MSLTSWLFGRKKTDPASPDGHQDFAPVISSKEGAKKERATRRELLYSVIRTVLTAAGLSADIFKFKVLSLDTMGDSFIVMVEVSGEAMTSRPKLMEMETLIAKFANERHRIIVAAVYWRLSMLPISRYASPSATQHAPQPAQPPAAPTKTAYDMVDSEEIAAFRNALTLGKKLSLSELATYAKKPQTVRADLNTAPSPLSATQYGELN